MADNSVSQEPFLDQFSRILHEIEERPHWVVSTQWLWATKAHLKNDQIHAQHLLYTEGEVDLTFMFLPGCTELATATVGYEYLKYDWAQNPYFSQTHFNTLAVDLLFSTSRWDNWFWQATFTDRFSPDNDFRWNYCRYDAEVWGRYTWSDKLRWHMGAIALWGLERNQVYPLIGLDYTINDDWHLNLVFPTNVSLVYSIDSNWTTALAARFYKATYRVSNSEPLPEGIFENTNYGAEWTLNYQYKVLNLRAFAGSTLAGHLKIYDRSGTQQNSYEIRPAFYGGVNFSVIF